MNNQTSLQQSNSPIPCAAGCGFFGTAATMNLCSKCYNDHRIKEDDQASSSSYTAVEKSLSMLSLSDTKIEEKEEKDEQKESSSVVEEVAGSNTKKKTVTRCGCCNKKVGLVGFKCKCGVTFCGSHRYPEVHDCSFDHKVAGRIALAKSNPLVIADKVQNI